MQNRCKKISHKEGRNLIREWGVSSFPDIDYGNWYLWDNCGVYVLINKGSEIDLHLAMRKGFRHRSRDMVSDVIKSTSKPLVGLIEEKYKHTVNLGVKMGFNIIGKFDGVRLDGTTTKVYKIRRDA